MRKTFKKTLYILSAIFIISGMLMMIPGNIFADTSNNTVVPLHGPYVGTDSSTFGEDSDDNGLTDPVVWHFVLNKLDKGTPAGTLTAVIEINGVAQTYTVTASVTNNKMQHFYLGTPGDGILRSASATVALQSGSPGLRLSHVTHNNTTPDETTTTIPNETTTTVTDETTTTVTDETTTTIPDETTTTVTDETTTTVTDETTTTIPGNTTTTVPGDTTTTVPEDVTTTVPNTVTTVLGIQETRRVDVLGVQETGQIDVLGIQELPFTGLRENLVILGLMFIITGLMTMILIPVLRRAGKH
jgi:hypothetical protein